MKIKKAHIYIFLIVIFLQLGAASVAAEAAI